MIERRTLLLVGNGITRPEASLGRRLSDLIRGLEDLREVVVLDGVPRGRIRRLGTFGIVAAKLEEEVIIGDGCGSSSRSTSPRGEVRSPSNRNHFDNLVVEGRIIGSRPHKQ